MSIKDKVPSGILRYAPVLDQRVAPLRNKLLETSYNGELADKAYLGEQEHPTYEFTGPDVQTTLDPFRNFEFFEDSISEIDERLNEMHGEGVNTALNYGSAVKGLSLLPEAAVFKSGQSKGKASDMDWVIVLETDDASLAAEQRSTVAGVINDLDGPAEVNPRVYGYEGFVDTLRDIRERTDRPEELRNEWFSLKWPEVEKPIPYVWEMETYLDGFIPHKNYSDEAVLDEIRWGMDMLTTEEGDIRECFKPLLSYWESDYGDRFEDLGKNVNLARERVNRSDSPKNSQNAQQLELDEFEDPNDVEISELLERYPAPVKGFPHSRKETV